MSKPTLSVSPTMPESAPDHSYAKIRTAVQQQPGKIDLIYEALGLESRLYCAPNGAVTTALLEFYPTLKDALKNAEPFSEGRISLDARDAEGSGRLAQARKNLDTAQLDEIVYRYPYTASGVAAAETLIRLYVDQGGPWAGVASLYVDYLTSHYDDASSKLPAMKRLQDPGVWLLFAVVYRVAGREADSQKAWKRFGSYSGKSFELGKQLTRVDEYLDQGLENLVTAGTSAKTSVENLADPAWELREPIWRLTRLLGAGPVFRLLGFEPAAEQACLLLSLAIDEPINITVRDLGLLYKVGAERLAARALRTLIEAKGITGEYTRVNYSAITGWIPDPKTDLPALQGLLRSPDLQVRRTAIYIAAHTKFPGIGRDIVDAYRRETEDNHRRSMMPYLGMAASDSPEAADIVIDLLKNASDASMVHAAGSALRNFTPELQAKAVPVALDRFRERSDLRAIFVAPWMWNPTSIAEPIVLEAIEDSDDQVRANALGCLHASKFRSEKIVPRLTELLDDPNIRLRMPVALAIATQGGPHAKQALPKIAKQLSAAGPEWSGQLPLALSKLVKDYPDEVLEMIETAAKAEEASKRRNAMLCYGQVSPGPGFDRAQAGLLAALDDKQPDVVYAAVSAICNAGRPVPQMLPKLEAIARGKESPNYSRNVVLGHLPTLGMSREKHLDLLLELLPGEKGDIQLYIVTLLQSYTDSKTVLEARHRIRKALEPIASGGEHEQARYAKYLLDALMKE